MQVLAGPAEALSLSVAPGPVTAGQPFPVAVTAFGNVTTTTGGMVGLTTIDPKSTVPAPLSLHDTQEASVTAQVVMRTLGAWAVSVTPCKANLMTSTVTVDVQPAPATSPMFVPEAYGAIAAELVSPGPVVMALDEFGN